MALPASDFMATLKKIAPLELAAEWDNVGLILEGPQDAPKGIGRGSGRRVHLISCN